MGRKFWAGFFCHAAVISLVQDAMGTDRYIDMLRTSIWISGWITAPLAGAAIFYFISIAMKE